MCLEEPSGTATKQLVLGRLWVHRSTRWPQLTSALNQIFTSYLQTVCGEKMGGEKTRLPLGLGPGSISTIRIGEDALAAQHVLPLLTFDLQVRKLQPDFVMIKANISL